MSSDPKDIAIHNFIAQITRAPIVSNENIKEKSTTTTYRSAERIISSNDISGLHCCSHGNRILLSAIIHRKQHAQTHFITKIHFPIDELSINVQVWCSCPFSSPNLWCSHAVSLMMLASQAQLGNLLVQPHFDQKCWRPKPNHALYKLPFVRETCLPWKDRLYLMISTEASASPEKRHASLVQDRVSQTYLLEKEKSKKRGRSLLVSNSSQKKTTSWTTALQCARAPILDRQQETYISISSSNDGVRNPPERPLDERPSSASSSLPSEGPLQPEVYGAVLISSPPSSPLPPHPPENLLVTSQEQDTALELPLSSPTRSESLSRFFKGNRLAGDDFGRGRRLRKPRRI